MEQNYFWSASSFIVKTYFVEHISRWSCSDIDLASYANDNTLYKACGNADAAVEILRMLIWNVFIINWKATQISAIYF